MKRYLIFSTFILIPFLPVSGQKKHKKIQSEKIIVNGVCERCQKRIEDAAYLPGVKRADWDIPTHELTLIYRPEKVSLSEIQKSIVRSGHDAGEMMAAKEDYNRLPDCCAYREINDLR